MPKPTIIIAGVGGKPVHLRKKLDSEHVAGRANVTRYLVSQIGKAFCFILRCIYVCVILLGLDVDLIKITIGDVPGRKPQDFELTIKQGVSNRTSYIETSNKKRDFIYAT